MRPFYCGTQALDWKSRNCDNCQKQCDTEINAWRCDIERAIYEAQLGDGSVSEEIAHRMGCIENLGHHNWRCGELITIMPEQEYYERYLKPAPSRLAPLRFRLWQTMRFAYDLWNPWWRPEVDIYGEPGRISLSLAWSVAWGVWHNARRRVGA